MYCTNCGRQVPDSTKFCPYCGAGLAARSTETVHGERVDPIPGPDPKPPEPPEPSVRPESPEQPVSPPRKKRRRWPFVLAAVLVALLLGAAALLFLASGDEEAEPVEEEEAVLSEVYYSDGTVPVVLGSTTIVFYNDEDEALEEYDLYLMDGTGAFWYCHVDAESGAFTPDRYGIESGTYRMVVRDPETNDTYTEDRIVVIDEEEDGSGSDDSDDADDADDVTASDDGIDYVYYEDELDIKPDPDGIGDEDGSTSARQAAYALYYARVLELQELYGEAVLDDAGECLSGLAFVGLVDLIGDGDGIEELVLIYDTDDEVYGDWFLEVWRYDAEANDIELVCEEPFGGTDDAQMMAIYDCGGTAELAWSYWAWEDPVNTFAYYVVRMDGDSLAVLEAIYTVNYDTDTVTYLVNGEEADWDTYNDYYDVILDAYTYRDSYCVTVYDAEAWATYSGDWYTTYDPTDTLAYTQATIVALQFGMMDLTEEELWGDGSEEADDAAAATAAYLELVEDYEASYGAISVADASGEYPYLTGLCFADFVDFDGDGTEELVLAYSTDAVDTENGNNDNYVVEVWTYDGDGLLLVHQGCEYAAGNGFVNAGFALYYVGDACYLIEGHDTVELYVYAYENGAFTEADAGIINPNDLTVTWLMYYGDDYSDATASLSETLAALGAS